jgi:putative ABC transport system permease protein
MVLLKLALSNFQTRKIRVALTVAAVAMSVSLVVSVTSGYASVEGAVFRYLAQYMGSTDVEIIKQNSPSGGTADSILEELRRDSDVVKVDGRYEATVVAESLKGEAKPPRAAAIGIRRPQDTNSDYLTVVKGNWFDVARGNVAVIDQALSERLKLDVGDEFVIPKSLVTPSAPASAISNALSSIFSSTRPASQPSTAPSGLRLKVVGVVHKPAMLAAYMHSMYVPIETLQEFAGKQHQISRIFVDTKTNADVDAFEVRWKKRLEQIDPNLKLRTARETRKQMDRNLEGVHALSYLGGTVSMLAATFIVFSALSMGVSERQRTLAMLRAVGAQRGQVGLLVVLEGFALSLVGVIVGVPLGLAWIWILAHWYSDVFAAGVVVSWGGILLGAGGSVAAALAASFLPAYTATRVSPLEAMSPQAAPSSRRFPWLATLCGVILASVDPFLFFGPIERMAKAYGAADPMQAARDVRFVLHFGVGLPCLMVGWFLISPMFVWVFERLLGPIVAAMFGLKFAMLRQQLTSGIWRVAGTCAALMVGLAVLVVMQTNGQTMLRGWRLPDRFPDIFISTGLNSGLNWEQQAKLASVPGIRNGEVMPIGIASPQFGSSIFGIGLAQALMPEATMFIAVPPDKAFKMMELEFKEGNPEDAARMLAMGDHVVVTDEFRQVKGLGLGDKLSLKTSQGVRDFTIAGVVWSPGIDVMVTMYDMGRQFDQRTAASVFGSLEDGRKYFGIEQVILFAANLDYFVERDEILKRVQTQLGAQGMTAGDVRHIKASIQEGFKRLLLLISTVAFAAMAVASLGVTNTIMASIRSRRWQFGVLRSIGVTRSQLMRLVMAEAVLIGLVGCGLGLAAGFEMSVDACRLSAVLTGYHPPMYIPWKIVWLGAGIVMAIALLASAWPAVNVARSEPLKLLQAGRAAA